jgi:hypothetical protein
MVDSGAAAAEDAERTAMEAAAAAAAAGKAKGKEPVAGKRVTRSAKKRQGQGDTEATSLEQQAGFWQCR